MRKQRSEVICTWAAFIFLLAAPRAGAQAQATEPEIQLQRCDQLPVAILQVDNADKRFLVDTAATSMLNEKSFPSGRNKEVHIQSWNETRSLNAREVVLSEVSLGSHHLRNIKLSAIDLSAIAKACGGRIDGILGVDLLEQLGVTIDLNRSVVRLGIPPPNSSELSVIADMERSMYSCSQAFNNADAEKLASCLDRDFVLSTPEGEYRGRDAATDHFRQKYFNSSPHAHLSMAINDQRAVGHVVWSSYDYKFESPSLHSEGRGMMICRKSESRWYILSMHESPTASSATMKP
jgi:ketosteroid isomerase-like protein